jgi:hypothetical protein
MISTSTSVISPASVIGTLQNLSARDKHLSLRDMESMVRAAGLRGLPALVDRLGGDGAELLARFHIAPDALDSDDAVIRSGSAGRVLETAAAELSCPDLGLRLAGQQNTSVLGPLALAIENSATFGDALDVTGRFLFVHSPALTVAQIPDPSGRPGVVGIRYAGLANDPLPPQAVDLGLGLLHRIILLLHGVRRAAAYRLITQTPVSLTQITAMVGLTEQSALSRAARRWFGVSPRELRRGAPLSPRPPEPTG